MKTYDAKELCKELESVGATKVFFIHPDKLVVDGSLLVKGGQTVVCSCEAVPDTLWWNKVEAITEKINADVLQNMLNDPECEDKYMSDFIDLMCVNEDEYPQYISDVASKGLEWRKGIDF